jgi:hypothetical protein
MGKAILVERYIDEGGKLLKALGGAGLDVVAAFWNYDPDADEWTLNVSTPLYDTEGPKAAYEAIQMVLRSREPPLSIRLHDIAVLSPRNNLTETIRESVRFPAPSTETSEVSHFYLGGAYIDKAIVYRVPPVSEAVHEPT